MEEIIPEVTAKQPVFGLNVSLKTNLFLSGVTTVAGFISGTVLIMVLGRVLSVAVFGEVVYAFTFASLATLIPSYGFPLMVVREVSQQRLSPAKAVVNVTIAQVLLSVITMLGLGIFAWIDHLPASYYLVLFIFVVSGILNAISTVISAVNKGLNDFTVEAKVAVISSLTLCAFILGFYAVFPPTSLTVGLAALASSVLGIGAARYLVKPLFRSEPGVAPDRAVIRNLLKAGLPFALHLILATLYFQIDTLIVGKILDMEAVGFYQAATRLVMAAIPVAMIVNNTFYPRLTKSYNSKTGTFTTSDPQKMLGALLALGIGGTLFLVVLAQPIISLVYGSKMLPSVPVLQTFALLLMFRFVAGGYGVLLISCRRQIVLVWTAGVATLVNVVFNIVFIPQYGIIASAWVNVATNLLILVIYMSAFHGRSHKWLSRFREAS